MLPPALCCESQIAPANAASVRAFLTAGFMPAGAEAHLTRNELGE